MNNIEGQIEIDLFPVAEKTDTVAILSNRPVLASRVMVGKSPEQVLSLLPLMFNVCGIAQGRVAISAITQQLGIQSSVAQEHARDMLVMIETVREHLMRIFLDWPDLFQQSCDNEVFPFVSGLMKETNAALFREGDAFSLDSELQPDLPKLQLILSRLDELLSTHVFQLPPGEWLSLKNIDDLTYWSHHSDGIAGHSVSTILCNGWGNQGGSHSQSLPELHPEQLLEQFNSDDADAFIRQPQWQGELYETTPLSRQQSHALIYNLQQTHENSLITRWAARLAELAGLPMKIQRCLDTIMNEGDTHMMHTHTYGVAQHEAARGRLIHRVEIQQNLVTRYQILAPTEWNFHPQGLIKQSLSGLQADNNDELRQLARLMINAIDPCVGYELRIH
jgi:Ni,Fe-hydrogenase I large subunit